MWIMGRKHYADYNVPLYGETLRQSQYRCPSRKSLNTHTSVRIDLIRVPSYLIFDRKENKAVRDRSSVRSMDCTVV